MRFPRDFKYRGEYRTSKVECDNENHPYGFILKAQLYTEDFLMAIHYNSTLLQKY